MRTKNAIGDPGRIRERARALKARGITYASMAKETGIRPQTLNRFVGPGSKTNRMHPERMKKFLKYLDEMEGKNRKENPRRFDDESLPEASTRLRSYLLQRFFTKGECDTIRKELDRLDIALLIRLYGVLDKPD